MTDSDLREQEWVPEACSLPTAERPTRRAEFNDLFETAVRERQRLSRTHLRLILAGPDGLKAGVEDLARRENECCSFFTFAVTEPRRGTVVFDIEVPTAYVDVLDALDERARVARGEG
jgi:hypothetical protein